MRLRGRERNERFASAPTTCERERQRASGHMRPAWPGNAMNSHAADTTAEDAAIIEVVEDDALARGDAPLRRASGRAPPRRSAWPWPRRGPVGARCTSTSPSTGPSTHDGARAQALVEQVGLVADDDVADRRSTSST